jgi:hypothetical protein
MHYYGGNEKYEGSWLNGKSTARALTIIRTAISI